MVGMGMIVITAIAIMRMIKNKGAPVGVVFGFGESAIYKGAY